MQKGKIILENGDIYEGKFTFNLQNGKIIYNNGNIYEGEWKNNIYNGAGKIIYKDDSIVSHYNSFDKDKNIVLIHKNNKSFLQIIKYKKITNTFDLPSSIKTFNELKSFMSKFTIDTTHLTSEEIELITCPISLSIMYVPIITSCNHTFSQSSIEKCDKCPLCRRDIIYFIPNEYITNILKKIKFKSNNYEYNLEEIKNLENLKIELENANFKIEKDLSIDKKLYEKKINFVIINSKIKRLQRLEKKKTCADTSTINILINELNEIKNEIKILNIQKKNENESGNNETNSDSSLPDTDLSDSDLSDSDLSDSDLSDSNLN